MRTIPAIDSAGSGKNFAQDRREFALAVRARCGGVIDGIFDEVEPKFVVGIGLGALSTYATGYDQGASVDGGVDVVVPIAGQVGDVIVQIGLGYVSRIGR